MNSLTRNMFLSSLIFLLSSLLVGRELEVLAADGRKYDMSEFPNMVVTEFIKGKAHKVEAGKVLQSWAAYGKCHEVWLTQEGTSIVCGTKGIWKYDGTNLREVFFEPKKASMEIHTCQPLDNGDLLVAVNGPKVILELSTEGKIKKMIKVPYLRSEARLQISSVRKLDDGGYLFAASGDNKIFVINSKGVIKRTIDLSNLQEPYQAKRIHSAEMMDNGNIIVGTGYGACLLEIDPEDNIVWSLTPDDIPQLGIRYVGGFAVKSNGNLIVAAYNSAFPLFEINRDKRIVWRLRRNRSEGIDKPVNLSLYD